MRGDKLRQDAEHHPVAALAGQREDDGQPHGGIVCPDPHRGRRHPGQEGTSVGALHKAVACEALFHRRSCGLLGKAAHLAGLVPSAVGKRARGV